MSKVEALEAEGLTVSRLLRYVATQNCTDRHLWDDAWAALADSTDYIHDHDKAYNELVEKQRQCTCTPCTARRVMNTGRNHE